MRERPNIVLFMPDQLRADAVGVFGNDAASTPNIDALAARGTVFEQAYSQHSVCSPSRVSMMTGWYPHTAGHRTLTYLLQPWEPNLLALLRSAGYHVAFAGHRGDVFAPGVTEASTDFSGFLTIPEQLFMPSPFPDGHRLADAFYHGRRPGRGPVVDFDEAVVRTAEAWLASGPPEPWVLFCPLMFPHPPFEIEEPWFSLHARGDVPKPAPPVEEGKPALMAALREAYGTDRLSPDDWAEIIATYYGMVSRVDDQLGRVLTAVDVAGCGDRTATFFFTDHGEYLGDFGLVEKWPAGVDDCLLRNPLVVAAPGGREAQRSSALVELVDLLPTLVDLAGGAVSHTHFGRSLVPLLDGSATAHRDAVFSEGGFRTADRERLEKPGGHYRKKGELQHDQPQLVGPVTAVRTEAWTYVHRLYERAELYDRAADPGETTNLAGTPAVADVERAMRDRVFGWLVETADVFPWDEHPRFPPIPHGYREPS
jgi:arylsulfatase A-like enzyme